MAKLTLLLKQNQLFFIGFFVFIIPASVLLLTAGNHQSFLLLNSYHTFWLDIFFSYYTNIGNGVFAILLGLIYIFILKKKEAGIAILSSFLLSGLIVQIIKHLII